MEQQSNRRRQTAPENRPQRPMDAARQLLDPEPAKRLTAIRLLAAARYAPARGALCAIARVRDGEEQLAALEALAELPGADDPEVVGLACELTHAQDARVVHAARRLLLSMLGDDLPAASEPPPREVSAPRVTLKKVAAPAPADRDQPSPHQRQRLVDQVLRAEDDAGRIQGLDALGSLGQSDLHKAFTDLLNKGDGDVVALAARRAQDHLKDAGLAVRREIGRSLLKARTRSKSAVARTACAEAALSLSPAAASVRLAGVIAETHEVFPLAKALPKVGPRQRREALGRWVGRLGMFPALIGPSLPTLHEHAGDLPPASQASLSALLLKATKAGAEDPALVRNQATLARLLGRLLAPNSALPTALVSGLSLSTVPDDHLAAIALCARVGTEEAAVWMSRLANTGGQVREAALAALQRMPAGRFTVSVTPDGVMVTPCFRAPDGKLLSVKGRALIDGDGREWVLDVDGRPVRLHKEIRGCECCFRARALQVVGDRRPSCPVSQKEHLLTATRAVLAEGYDYGPCRSCNNRYALVPTEAGVACCECGIVHVRRGNRWVPKNTWRDAMGNGEARDGEPSRLFPDRPQNLLAQGAAPSMFDQLSDHEARVLRATVTLRVGVDDPDHKASGTGFLISSFGNRFALLTTRHLFETDKDGCELRAPRHDLVATCVNGETVPCKVAWRASGSLDVALVIIEVLEPQALEVLSLAEKPPRLASELVSFGNAGGLPWSMFRSNVAGVRKMPTPGGVQADWVQLASGIPSGMGGAPLVDDRGDVCGLFSFFTKQYNSGVDIDLALSGNSIRQALVRERISFGTRPLVAVLGEKRAG